MGKSTNAYFIFMLDVKKKKEAELNDKIRLEQISGIASQLWSKMSEEEKLPYKEKANKRKDKSNGEPKTTHGIPVKNVVEMVDNETLQRRHIVKRISDLIDFKSKCADFDELTSYPFYFMAGNYFYKYGKDFIPAEISIVKFSIKNGIECRYHTCIDPQEIKMGYRFEAKALSEDNHRLPIPPSALGETDFSKVYRKIRSLLPTTEFDGSKPFVFTSVEETTSEETNIEVLKSFIAQMSGDRRNPIEIMPLARLLYALMEKLASVGRAASIGNVNIARTILSSTRFDYTSGISCNYHEEIDEMQRCTLARATRYALLLSSNVCRPLGVQLVLGKHLAPSTKSILQTKSLTQSMSCFSFSTDESESEISSAGSTHDDDDSVQGSETSNATLSNRRRLLLKLMN